MTASIPCPEAQAHLPLYVGGDLEAPLAAVVAEHLEGCPTCAERREALDRARGALLGLATGSERKEEVDLWPGIRARLAEEGVLEPVAGSESGVDRGDLKPALPRPTPILRFAPRVAVAAAAVLALALWRPWVTPETTPATVPDGASLALEDPVVPRVIPVANQLRPADPDLERLRPTARPFPTDGRVMPLGQPTGGRGLSAVSDERLR